jgi:L-iditol 2-dehydrogenase
MNGYHTPPCITILSITFASLPAGIMSSTVTEAVTKPNIGVYTNPEHKLWVAETKPAQQEAATGANLKEGEVTLAVKSTGICG